MNRDRESFEYCLALAKRLQRDCDIMMDSAGKFHLVVNDLRHWKKHYKTVTEIRMKVGITGRTE